MILKETLATLFVYKLANYYYYFPFFLFVYGRTFTISVYAICPHHYAVALNFHRKKIEVTPSLIDFDCHHVNRSLHHKQHVSDAIP